MPVLTERDREAVKERLDATLQDDVTIKLFTQSAARGMLLIPGQQQPANEYAKVTQELLQEMAEISPKVHVKVYDIYGDGADEAKRLGIREIPVLVLGDDEEGRVRFYGAPLGNEFATILETLGALSQGEPHLSPRVATAVKDEIQDPVHVQVFVTPT